MRSAFNSTTSRLALVAATLVCASSAAYAESFTVGADEPNPSATKNVGAADVGTVNAGATLQTTGVSIRWNANATGAGVVITNNGTIISGGRAIDTQGAVTGPFTLTNNGSITSADDLFRVNTPAANSVITIGNSGSMLANGGQAIDFASANSATATVSITNSGSITAAASDAVRLAAGTATITNSGTIQSTDSGSRALTYTAANLQSLTLTNEAAGQLIGGNDAIKISGNASNATITIDNKGFIDGGAGQALDFADLTSTTNVITITNSGIIQSATADAIRPGAGATVINSGLIQSTDLTATGDAVDFQGAGGRVENTATGRIIGAKHGVTGDGAVTVINESGGLILGSNGSGINIDSTGDTVTTVINRGTIRGAATLNIDDDGAPDGIPDGDGDGIDVDGYLDLTNSGTVQGTGATGTNDGLPNTADGIAAGGGVIRNLAGGVIEAFDVIGGGVGRAILIDDSNQGAAPFATTIENAGTIRSDGVAITLIGEQDDTIDNAGLISSDNEIAVSMGGGDDLFISRVGSQVIGAVDAGAGALDVLSLAGTGGTFALGDLSNTGKYRNFEFLNVQAGASYTATGATAFDGSFTVQGQLALNGSAAAASASVSGGGVLSGNAVIGNIGVYDGGALAPGTEGTVGTMATNALVFDEGSTYRVDVIGSTADQVNAATVSIFGGSTLEVNAVDVRIGDTYDIITATDGGGGMFETVSAPSLIFADPTVTYEGDAVTLGFERNDVAFASLAATPNQASVAAALDGAAAGSDIASYVGGATDVDAYRRSLDLLSGEAHASVGTSLFAQNTLVADAVLSRLRQAGAASATSAGGTAMAYAKDDIVTTAFGDLKAPYAPKAGPVYTAWAQGFGQWSRADGRNGSSKVEGSLGGFLAGADVSTEGLTFGLAGGYISADSNVSSLRSNVDADTALIAAYAGAQFDAVRLSAGASYGWSEIDSRRTVQVGALTERPKGDYDGSTANAFAEAAYAFDMGAGRIEPFAQIAWSKIETDSFSEKNAPISGLRVRGLDFDTVYTTLGARFAATVDSGFGAVTPHATLAWRHAMKDITPRVAASFVNGGGAFTTAGAPIGKDSLLVEGGVNVGIGANTTVGVSYEGQFAKDARTNAVKGRFAYSF